MLAEHFSLMFEVIPSIDHLMALTGSQVHRFTGSRASRKVPRIPSMEANDLPIQL